MTEAPAATPHSDRLDRIEAAIARRLNINLSDFDGQEILSARAEKLKQAGLRAAELVKEAFVEEELTTEQRLARIEKALTTGGPLT